MKQENVENADDVIKGIRWWNSLSKSDRLYWMEMAKSAKPSDAWAWFKKARPEEVPHV